MFTPKFTLLLQMIGFTALACVLAPIGAAHDLYITRKRRNHPEGY